MTEEVDEFLAHFGVKGMHWGVVRERLADTGRVRPVDPEKAREKAAAVAAKVETKKVKAAATQAKREVSAQKFELKASDLQKQINELNSRQYQDNYSGRNSAKTRDEIVRDIAKKQTVALKDADARRQGKLTSTQKKVIAGAAVVAALIATKVVVDNVQSGEFNRLKIKGKGFIHGKEAAEFAKRDILSKKMSPDLVHKLVVKEVNPEFGKIGTKMNCRRATFAYELRRRGLDVSATRTTNGKGQSALGLFNAVTPDEKFKSTSTPSYMKTIIKEGLAKNKNKDAITPLTTLAENFGGGSQNKIPSPKASTILDALSKQPNGSRGELGVTWKFGGGHSMAYEIFDGKPVIFDAQSGEKFADAAGLAKHGLDQIKAAGFTRLDNVDLNMDYLKRWVKNAK